MGKYDYSKSSMWNIEHGNGIAPIPEIIKPPSKNIEEEKLYFICRKCEAEYYLLEKYCDYYEGVNQFERGYISKCPYCDIENFVYVRKVIYERSEQ